MFGVDSAPDWLQPITRVLPLRFLVDGLREQMTKGRGIDDIWQDMVYLMITFAVGTSIAVRFFKWDARST